MKEFEKTAIRDATLGSLGPDEADRELRLAGWVHRRRDLGSLIFLVLRDRSGLLQVSLGPDWTEEASLILAGDLGAEDVVAVEGFVRRRPEDKRNPEMPTGDIEFQARSLTRLSKADVPAIPVYRSPDDELPAEELRLQHRVLDLRRSELQSNLILRHRLVLETRNYLSDLGFLEIETPMLTKPTPEGARDYVVPSRIHPGHFFALPQSPQLYKQILMVSGFDRYFQIARCFRDEDLRADRQPEFTQIDVEASFVEPEDILVWIEGLMHRLGLVAGIDAPLPFPRLSYAAALERYGSDRPDLRYTIAIQDWSDVLRGTDSKIIESALVAGHRVRGIVVPGGGALSRKELESLEKLAKATGAPGLFWGKRTEDGGSGPLGRFLDEPRMDHMGVEVGDVVLAAAGPDRVTSPALDAVRVPAARAAGLTQDTEHAWLWVTEFPVFDQEEDGTLTASHHAFVMPHADDLELLESDPARVRGTAYDLVYNGTEFGSGSIRIHDSSLQRRVLSVLGLTDHEIDHKFAFLLRALDAGAPPHGGIALGVDRIVQRFTGAASLRDVIAFPKTTAARALYEGAPSRMSEDELTELHLRLAAAGQGSPEAQG
jgi:aspartyl-tRNA synthetase